MVWIVSENPDAEPFDLRVVKNLFEASILNEHQAQQIARRANERERDYVWEHVPLKGGFIVQGK
jgi:hypothetical protein